MPSVLELRRSRKPIMKLSTVIESSRELNVVRMKSDCWCFRSQLSELNTEKKRANKQDKIPNQIIFLIRNWLIEYIIVSVSKELRRAIFGSEQKARCGWARFASVIKCLIAIIVWRQRRSETNEYEPEPRLNPASIVIFKSNNIVYRDVNFPEPRPDGKLQC